jgi:hypothetical protein
MSGHAPIMSRADTPRITTGEMSANRRRAQGTDRARRAGGRWPVTCCESARGTMRMSSRRPGGSRISAAAGSAAPEAHPTRALAGSLLVAAFSLASATGCSGVANTAKQPVAYTFDHGTEGWVLNKRRETSFKNLGANGPDGVSPTLTFVESEGDPSPGSLRLTVAFTGPAQFAAAGIVFGQPRDLSGKMLHARVRLVSGPAAGAWAGLYACGTRCVEEGAIDATELAGGAWASLALDLDVAATHTPINALPSPNFIPASVSELGIEVYTWTPADGGAADGGASTSTGEVVLEIDTVTD